MRAGTPAVLVLVAVPTLKAPVLVPVCLTLPELPSPDEVCVCELDPALDVVEAAVLPVPTAAPAVMNTGMYWKSVPV